MDKNFGYEEKQTALDNRINAHAKYSNFNLHNWLNTNFPISKGDHILDLGCGNGNFTKLFYDKVKQEGFIYGFDKNKDLILDAKDKFSSLSKNIVFEVVDYDSLHNIEQSFDWVFSIYSIYYTRDSMELILRLRKLLNRSGKLILIGPAQENATDLAKFNYEVTGVKNSTENELRSKRIESEFFEIFKKVFGVKNVKLELINSEMNFNTVDEYSEYYWSTLLWRESIKNFDEKKIGILKDRTLTLLSSSVGLKITKQMSCLTGNHK